MTRIESSEQFGSLCRDARREGLNLTNCYLLADAVQKKAESGKLYYERLGDVLLIEEDCGDFLRLRYYMSASSEAVPFNPSKSCVTEFPFNDTLTERQAVQTEKLLKMGFSLGRESILMEAKPEDIKELSGNDPALSVEAASKKDIKEIKELLYDTFDPLYAFLPDDAELEKITDGGKMLCVYTDCSVAGVLNYTAEKNCAWISHLAVKNEYRKNGIAKALIDEYHRKCKGCVLNFRLWTDKNNNAARGLYESAGYILTARRANEYIIRKEI